MHMFYNDFAIDLGTANILISIKNHGIVLREPSIMAFDNEGVPIGMGREAWEIHEKTHNNIRTIRPLRDGVIADFEAAEHMIRGMIKSVKTRWYTRTRQMVVCVPSGITEVERQAVRSSAQHAGATKVFLVDEPMAAAIGIGINIHEPVGRMVVDIGGGTAEIAVIALSEVMHAQSVRIAGDRFNEDIITYFRRNLNMLISERMAEVVKCEIGSAAPLDEELKMNIKGRDLVSGIPKTAEVTSQEVREAIEQSVGMVIQSVVKSLEQTPPELAADIVDHGIMLAGGGALLKNLDTCITEVTGLPVHIADDPLTAVIRGTSAVLDKIDYYKEIGVAT